MSCRQAIRRDPLFDRLTPGQRAKLKRIRNAYSATEPGRTVPLVMCGRISTEQDDSAIESHPLAVEYAPVVIGCGETARHITPRIRPYHPMTRRDRFNIGLGILMGVALCAAVYACTLAIINAH